MVSFQHIYWLTLSERFTLVHDICRQGLAYWFGLVWFSWLKTRDNHLMSWLSGSLLYSFSLVSGPLKKKQNKTIGSIFGQTVNSTYFKCTEVLHMLTYFYTHKTITSTKMVNTSVTLESFSSPALFSSVEGKPITPVRSSLSISRESPRRNEGVRLPQTRTGMFAEPSFIIPQTRSSSNVQQQVNG